MPFWPYREANGIAWRARSILRGRSREQIVSIAEDIDSIVEAYFDAAQASAIEQVRAAGRSDLMRIDEDGRFDEFDEDAYDLFDIRNKDNTSELEALQEAIDSFFDPSTMDIENLMDHEYFAVFALSLLDDFITKRDYQYDFKSMGYKQRERSSLSSSDMVLMGQTLLEAMDAINYAEKQREIQSISKRYESKIKDIKESTAALTQEAVENRVNEVREEIKEEEKRQKREMSVQRNDLRHADNRAIKKLVLSWFDEDPRKFPSAEKAADDFCDRLLAEKIVRSHRTVADWVRQHARTLGIRFRP